MPSLTNLIRYTSMRFQYAVNLAFKNIDTSSKFNSEEVQSTMFRTFLFGKLTFLHWTRGEEMAPIVTAEGGTVLVRKMERPAPWPVYVGDVVLLKHPEKPDDYLVRRLAALEGYELVSNDEKDEPFVLEKDQCWVVSDNESLKAKEANDSRLFGPVPTGDIVGRVIYALRSAVDHGPVKNSDEAMSSDAALLDVELDVEEMAKNNKT